MQYVPLSDLRSFLGKPGSPAPAERQELMAALDAAYAEGRSLDTGGSPISYTEARTLAEKLDHPAAVVFDQWIMQSKGLRNLLIDHSLSPNDFDPRIVREHRLFPEFSKFVTPFLIPALHPFLERGNDKDLFLISGYVDLPDEEGRLMVQSRMDSWLSNQLAIALGAAQKASTEDELAKAVRFMLSDDVIALVNRFHKSFYASKIAYTDRMLEVMRMRACTERLGSWISGQLQKLELNPEHMAKIKEITGTVRSGKAGFANQAGKVSVGFGSVKMAALVIALIFGAIAYFTWFPPFFKRTEDITDTQKTSFSQFTPQERRQMDSLIRTMTGSQEASADRYSDGRYLHLPSADMNVIYREPYKNGLAEQFHQDCLRDQELIGSGQSDSCATYRNPGEKRYPGFRKLSENKGSQEMFLQNESPYQVLIVVFKDNAGEPVFASLADEGGKISFRMEPGQTILFLPGSEWAPFKAVPAVSAEELPSDNYKHHFCLQDENFKAMLLSPYRLTPVHRKLVKLMLNESSHNNADFFLIDLYDALEQQ